MILPDRPDGGCSTHGITPERVPSRTWSVLSQSVIEQAGGAEVGRSTPRAVRLGCGGSEPSRMLAGSARRPDGLEDPAQSSLEPKNHSPVARTNAAPAPIDTARTVDAKLRPERIARNVMMPAIAAVNVSKNPRTDKALLVLPLINRQS